MTKQRVDVRNWAPQDLCDRVLDEHPLEGGSCRLFELEEQADITDLMAAANRIRQHFKGNRIHLCSIVNAKAGGCSENSKFCSQSSAYQTHSNTVLSMQSCSDKPPKKPRKPATAVGLVAAWKGLREGPILDEVCDRIRRWQQRVCARMLHAWPDRRQPGSRQIDSRTLGWSALWHNLKAPEDSFPEHCTTHSFDDRLKTIGFLQKGYQDLQWWDYRYGESPGRSL